MGSQKRCISIILFWLVFIGLASFAHAVVAVQPNDIAIRIVSSDGNPIENVKIRYCTSSWYDAGTTDSNGEVFISVPEKFSTIRARAYYNGAYFDIKQNIRENSLIEFKTIQTSVLLKNSMGEAIQGGYVKFCFSSWAEYGVTDNNGQAVMELLPARYTFRMSYEEGRVDVKQDIGQNPEVLFQTIKTKVSLKGSSGNGLEGGAVKYVRSSWRDFGTTDAEGNAFKELLAGTYTFRMSYEEGRVDIKQDIGQNPEVLFQTANVTVRLEDGNGNGLEGGKIRYVRSSWRDFGITGTDGNASKQVLIGTYTFRMYIGSTYQNKKVEITGDTQILFVSLETPAKTWTLTTSLLPSQGGAVLIAPSKNAYTDGEKVTFQVTAAQGYSFSGYGGQNGDQVINNTLTMNGNKSVTILFEETNPGEEYKITASVQPVEGGSIIFSPSKELYLYGESVVVSAAPADGFEFVEISGTGINGSVTTLPYTIEITEDISITAQFQETGEDQTIIVHNIEELNQAEITAQNGNITILLDDGIYELANQFVVSADHVTVKSLNGDASKVTVRGKGMNGNVPHVFEVYGQYFTIESITLGWVKNHGIQIHGEHDADYPVIRDVHFKDTYEQMIKVSASSTQTDFCDGGIVEKCSFIYTAGVGPQWYIGGVDAHRSKGWIVKNNLFEDITSPTSALSEGAIHFWSDSTDTLAENNLIIDCDRGVMFGLDNSHHYGGIIRNNFIHVNRDVGIYAANAHGTKIYNNTVFVDGSYPNAIEYRFTGTIVDIANNLANKNIISRNGAVATLSHNVEYAIEDWFENPHNGDLHLKEAVYVVVDQGMDIDGLAYDIDGDIRQSGKVDIGADEFSVQVTPPSSTPYYPEWSDIQASEIITLEYDSSKNSTENGAILKSAIQSLIPGQKLEIGQGVWSVNSWFSIDLKGTAQRPIWICAKSGEQVVLTRPDTNQNAVNIGANGGTRYLAFQNIEITGGDTLMKLYDCANVWIHNCHIHHGNGVGIAANSANTDHLYLTENEIHDTGGTAEGMYLGANNSVKIMTDSIIAANHIYNCYGSQGDGIEVKQGSYNNWIVANHIHDTNYPCILVYGTDGNGLNIIEKNIIYRSNDNTMQVQGEAVVLNNLIISGTNAGFASTDHQGETKNLEVIHNTIINSGRAVNLSSWNNRTGMILSNNVIYSKDAESIRFPNGSSGVTVTGNVVLGTVSGIESGFIYGNGLSDFVSISWDGTNRNGTPSDGSPVIGYGDNAYAADYDITGKRRGTELDPGAFDYQ